MQYRTVVERVGERLGDIDWTFDFTSHDWNDGRGGCNPVCSRKATELLREMETAFKSGKTVLVGTYGDSLEPVCDVGMYDGWPFWKPTPSFQSSTWLGASWHPWTSIRCVKIEEQPCKE